jgi:hypothetical protein
MVCGVGSEDVGVGTRAGGEAEVEAADIFRENKIDITFWSLGFFWFKPKSFLEIVDP